MRQKKIINIEQDRIGKLLEAIDEKSRYEFQQLNLQELSLSEILSTCIEVWGCSEEDIIGKIKHQNALDKARRFSFLWASYLYASKGYDQIAKYMGCYSGTVYSAFIFWKCGIIRSWKYCDKVLAILEKLRSSCPNRFELFSKIDFSMIKGVRDGFTELNKLGGHNLPFSILDIPIQNNLWFYNENTKFDMFAFSEDGSECKMITFSRTSDYRLLYLMQFQGYRFISYTELFKEYYTRLSNEISQRQKEYLKTLDDKIEKLEAMRLKSEEESKADELNRLQLTSSDSQELYDQMNYEDFVKYAFNIKTANESANVAISFISRLKKLYGKIEQLNYFVPQQPGLTLKISM